MLQVFSARNPTAPALMPAQEGGPVFGLREDTDYLIGWGGRLPADKLYVDDVEVVANSQGLCAWRPEFFAGRVRVEVERGGHRVQQHWLDVGPAASKSGEDDFREMVQDIRAYDPALLGGQSAATMLFGRHGREGLLSDDVLLTRIQQHAPSFLDAIDALARSPHQVLSAQTRVLPLSQVRRIPVATLRDRKVATLVSGALTSAADHEAIYLRGLTCSTTFDTPANRATAALMRRLHGTLSRLIEAVESSTLGVDKSAQELRRPRRLSVLYQLESRLRRALVSPPFESLRQVSVSAAGLTQVAANPAYSRAYSLGSRALDTGVHGEDSAELLHVAHSWGIYETWCYLHTIQRFAHETDATVEERSHSADGAVSSLLAHRLRLPDGIDLLFQFQALFPAGSPSGGRVGYSISRERRPDVVVSRQVGHERRWLVLDAKWRSGRDNVLQAMESAHIYHDSLRLSGRPPEAALLLLPGVPAVSTLEEPSFRARHGVGAISHFGVKKAGTDTLQELLCQFAASGVIV